jgi:hypothetical protein
MTREATSFLCGHDLRVATIDALPSNVNHGDVVYCDEIDALCVFDATADQTPPVAKNGSWKAMTPIKVAGTPGTADGLGSVWCVVGVGTLAIDVTNALLYMATVVSTTITWETVYNQS